MKFDQNLNLNELKEQLGDLIIRLALNDFQSGVGTLFDIKMRQCLACLQREVVRRIDKLDSTPAHYMEMRVISLMVMHLGEQFLAHGKAKRAQGLKRTKAEYKASRFLKMAMLLLDSAVEELSKTMPLEPIGDLGKRFYLNFYEVPRHECYLDALAVQSSIEATVQSGVTIEQIKARIAEIEARRAARKAAKAVA